ncbi:J domain-containing protein [Paraburkholderia sp. DGU8]|uniref:J domain-containing protein n=1 Tax=Paraburkholderia sp. DGU8 TaxID=3161997 RepID=UPI003467E73E
MTTLYETLGVHAHATDEEIKRAYRKAAMKWHPDRNHGAEKAAHAAFQEIKDAYAILSDAEQRKVYDAVYAEQMRHWEAQRERQQQAQAQRAAAARAADEAAYAEMVSVAIRFADEGHNRDVLFGVLLGRQCEPRRAAQIADSVAALQASRREAAKAGVAGKAAPATDPANAVGAGEDAEMPPQADTGAVNHATTDAEPGKRAKHTNQATPANHDEPAADAHPAGALGGLWFQFLNSLRF